MDRSDPRRRRGQGGVCARRDPRARSLPATHGQLQGAQARGLRGWLAQEPERKVAQARTARSIRERIGSGERSLIWNPTELEMSERDVVVVSAARTAIGSFGASLRDVPLARLATVAVKGALDRSGVDPAEVGH